MINHDKEKVWALYAEQSDELNRIEFDCVYDFCWEQGHSNGYEEVVNYIINLEETVRNLRTI